MRHCPKRAQKNRPCGRCRCRGVVPDEARRRDARRCPLQSGREGMWEGPPRGRYFKANDEALLPLIRRFVDERPTYGYRRITALVNRELVRQGLPGANRKRVHRIMQRHALLLESHTGRREGRIHDGKVMVMCSNLRWCSDGLEFTCWNGDIIRMVFIIDAFDREILAWPPSAAPGSAAPTCAT